MYIKIKLSWRTFCKVMAEKALPHVFVSTVSNEIKGRKIRVHCKKVQAQKHGKHFNNHPDQGSTSTKPQHLWTEPAPREKTTGKQIWYDNTGAIQV